MISVHNRVVEAIAEICKETDSYKKICVDHISSWDEDYCPLAVKVTSRRKRPIAENYVPDVWAKRKGGKIDIYEVFDTEDLNAAVADMCFAALVENICDFHVVCLGKLKIKRVYDLAKLFLSKMKTEKGDFLIDPNSHVWVLEIPENIRNNKKEIKKYIIDKWWN